MIQLELLTLRVAWCDKLKFEGVFSMSPTIPRPDSPGRGRYGFGAAAMLTMAALLVGGTTGSAPVLADHPVRAAGTWEVLGAARSLPTFYQPTDVTVDPRGNVYVADSGNRRVVKLSPQGRVVGQLGQGSASGNGRGVAPTSVTVDRRGNLYVGDVVHQRLAKFSPGGRQVAQWDLTVKGATVDQMVVRAGPAGNVVVVMVARIKSGSYLVVQRRSPDGKILNVWPNARGSDTGQYVYVLNAAVDSRGNVYLTHGVSYDACLHCNTPNPTLDVYSPSGRLLRSLVWGPIGAGGVAVGGRGNVFLADGRRLVKLSSAGRQLAELFPLGVRGPVVEFAALALDRAGNIYASDREGNRLVKASPSGRLLAQWGAGGSGPGQLLSPSGLAIDPHGQLWVMDLGNQRVKHLSPDGRMLSQWPAHSGSGALAVDARGNVYVGNGDAIDKYSPRGRLLARINAPRPVRLAIGSRGDVFVLTPNTFWQVLELSPTGRVVARLGPRVCYARGLALDRHGNIYESEESCRSGGRLLKLSRRGKVLASWGERGSGDGRFRTPGGVAVDQQGNIYGVDSGNDHIWKLSPSAVPVASWGSSGFHPGQFHFATYRQQDNYLSDSSIAVDDQGRVFVADTGNHRIQRFTP